MAAVTPTPNLPICAGAALGGFWRDTFGRDVLRETEAPLRPAAPWIDGPVPFYPVSRTPRTATLDLLFDWLNNGLCEDLTTDGRHVNTAGIAGFDAICLQGPVDPIAMIDRSTE